MLAGPNTNPTSPVFRLDVIALVAAATVAGLLVFSGTPLGLGLSADSVAYERAARLISGRLASGSLPSQWPPLYPASLALAASVLGDPAFSARVLHALLAGTSVLLAAAVFRRCALPAACAAVLAFALALQPGFVDVHLMLWSEPEFIAMVLVDLIALERLAREPTKSAWLLLAGASGAAMLVRYAGLVLLPVDAVVVVGSHWRTRRPVPWAALGIACGAAFLPILCWAAFNFLRSGNPVNRVIVWHPPDIEQLTQLSQSLAAWLFVPKAIALVVPLLLLGAAVVSIARWFRAPDELPTMPAICATFVLGYLVFLLVSITWVDHATPLDERILAPALPASMAVLASSLRVRLRLVRHCLFGGLLFLLALNALPAWQHWQQSRSAGVGYASRLIRDMPVLRRLSALPGDLEILTNSPEIVSVQLHRDAQMLPVKVAPGTARANAHFAADLDASAHRADLVIYFYTEAWRTYLPTPEEIGRVADLEVVYQGRDAVVWRRTSSQSHPPGR